MGKKSIKPIEHKVRGIRMPNELWEYFRKNGEDNHRTTAAEIVHNLQRLKEDQHA